LEIYCQIWKERAESREGYDFKQGGAGAKTDKSVLRIPAP
jgi:hypothetical protein